MKVAGYISFLLLLLLTFGCEEHPPVNMGAGGMDYFPLEIGRYWTYQVDSVHYDDYTEDSTHHVFRLREIVESIFIDGEGRQAYRIERHRYDTTFSAWRPVGVRVAVLTPSKAEKVEENIRFIKLAFPLKKNRKWDGNSMNILAESEYTILALDEQLSVGAFSFDSTCTVEQANIITLISKEHKTESYAKGVGMIHRSFIELKTSITGIIESGYKYEYLLLDYGKL